MIALLLMWLQAASGHPNALRMPAHVTSVHVDSNGIRVDYAVELPGHRHRGSTRPAEDAQSAMETLSGVTLYVDGTSEALVVEDQDGPQITPKGSAITRLTLHSDRVPVRNVTVQNANYPGMQGYFSTAVTVSPEWLVQDSSLFSRSNGSIQASKAGTWQAGNQARTTSITLLQRPTWQRAVFVPLAGIEEVRSAWRARQLPWYESLWSATPLTWLFHLVAGALLGAAHPNNISRRYMAITAVAAVGLAALPGSLSIAAAVATCAAGLSAGWPWSQLAWASGVLLLGCLGAPGLVAVCIAVTLLFIALPDSMTPPTAVVGIPSAVLWLRAMVLTFG